MVRLLDVTNLAVRFGAAQALRGVSLHVSEAEIVAVIGANGAGKSVLLKAIMGAVRPCCGDISYRGRSIAGWPSHRIAGLGIGLVPEGRRLFPSMTVMENLQLGAHHRADKKEIAADMERLFTIFPRLAERRRQLADTLSGGEQEMVAIGRALMSKASVLLLDEPSLGIAPLVVRSIAQALTEIQQKEGLGIVLVEQNARLALSVADRAYVLESGNVVLEGPAAEVARSDHVRRAYLGI